MTVPYNPEHITYFAETDYRNQRTRFGIKSRDRTRHMYVIGKSGVGKSTLLENMAIQDIQHGEGIAVLDPHGSFADKMLDYVPANRIKDVIYLAPFDTNHPISFNLLEDVGPERRHFVTSGLMSTFKKIWVDAWSARMEYILNNILLALLEYPGATLLGVNRMLADKEFRKKVVDCVTDPGVKAFWVDEFAKYGERYMQEAGAAIQNKIGQFVANPLVRNIIGQPKSSFDIRQVMDDQKILIINLSKGRIGEQNTSLLGSMIITKIYLAAMSRADVSNARLADLPNFYFYVDEFQSFANETFADILSEARKYKLALIIAHQYVAQMEEPVRDAVFGNVGTSISFRVGALDAELLEKVFAPQFTQNDLINLGMAQVYLSLLINDIGSPAFSARTLPPLPKPPISYRNDIIEWTRTTFAAPKEKVEKDITEWFIKDVGTYTPDDKRPRYEGGEQRKQPFKEGYARPQQENYARVPRTEYAPKPQERAQEKPTEKPLEKPFAKAFAKEAAELKETETTPALKALLSSLSLDGKPEVKKEEPVVIHQQKKAEVQPAPFDGEKSLKDTIQPVKLGERGPTEKNRDLLKAALKQVTETPKAKEVPETEKIPDKPDTENKEISYQDLRKVLD